MTPGRDGLAADSRPPRPSTTSERPLHPGRGVYGVERASDLWLVAMTRAGCEEAFTEIVRRYEKPLRSHCERLVGGDRAKDAVQQAFLQAFQALRADTAREIALRPWLYRISRNCAIDLLRRNGWEYEELDPALPGTSSPLGIVEQKQRLDEVLAAIRTLPERQRRALVLREVEGRSYREIAPKLGDGASGVHQLIFRARTRLRQALGALLPLDSLRGLLARAASAMSERSQQTVEVVCGTGTGGALRRMGAVALVSVGLLCEGDGVPLEAPGSPTQGRPAVRVALAGPDDGTMSGPGKRSAGTARAPARPGGGRVQVRIGVLLDRSGTGAGIAPKMRSPAATGPGSFGTRPAEPEDGRDRASGGSTPDQQTVPPVGGPAATSSSPTEPVAPESGSHPTEGEPAAGGAGRPHPGGGRGRPHGSPHSDSPGGGPSGPPDHGSPPRARP